MATPSIPFEPGTVYHIYNRSNQPELLFRENENYRYFMQLYRYYLSPVVDTLAWCLMPNHFHFLLRIQSEEALIEYAEASRQHFETIPLFVSRQFARFFAAYAKGYNSYFDRNGSLFQRGIRKKAVLDDTYYRHLIWYLHMNPVKAELARSCEDWQYSSYRNILTERSILIRTDDIIAIFGNKHRFVEAHLSPEDDVDISMFI